MKKIVLAKPNTGDDESRVSGTPETIAMHVCARSPYHYPFLLALFDQIAVNGSILRLGPDKNGDTWDVYGFNDPEPEQKVKVTVSRDGAELMESCEVTMSEAKELLATFPGGTTLRAEQLIETGEASFLRGSVLYTFTAV